VKNRTLAQLVRPPGTLVLGRPYVLQQFFSFFSSRDLLGPWADLREILPHSRKHVQFTSAGPKIWGHAPSKKNWGAKNMLNLARFQTSSHFEREYLLNG